MVIIIEDDEISGRLLVKMLEEFYPNQKYHWLRSVSESIDYISNYHSNVSDLLLLDFYLTDGVAWEILDQIKLNLLEFKGKIILMPGIKPNEEESILINKYRPFKVLVKPINIETIKAFF